MCREDLRIGRKKYTSARLVTVALATDTPLVAQANNRTHLSFHVARDDAVVYIRGTVATAGRGAFLSSVLPPIDFDIETHGDCVTAAWNGQGVTGSCDIYVIETFFDDGVYP